MSKPLIVSLVPGDDWAELITVTNPDGSPVDYSGWTILVSEVSWSKGSIPVAVDLYQAGAGKFGISAGHAGNATLPLGPGSNLLIRGQSPAGKVETIYYGTVDGVKIKALNALSVVHMGIQGAPGVLWRGPWQSGAAYLVSDGVYLDGSSYRATASHQASMDNVPGTGAHWHDVWSLIASKGDKGDTGDLTPEVIAARDIATAAAITATTQAGNAAGSAGQAGAALDEFKTVITSADNFYVDGRLVDFGVKYPDNRFAFATFADGGAPYLPGYTPTALLPDFSTDIAALKAIITSSDNYYIDGKLVDFGVRYSDGYFSLAFFADGTTYIANYTASSGGGGGGTPPAPITSVALYGDSLSVPFAPLLAAALGRTVNNRGIGSQGAQQIATRQGGYVQDITVSGNQIVAGSNTVTHFNGVVVAGNPRSTMLPLSAVPDNTTRTLTVVIAGVIGMLQRTASGGPPSTSETYTFTPDAGQTVPVTCPPRTPMRVIGSALSDVSLIQVIWAGANDKFSLGGGTIEPYIAAMTNRLRLAGNVKFVIMGIINGEYADEYAGGTAYVDITTFNRNLAAAYPDNFFDTRRWLIDKGLAAAGIMPTAQDLIDIGRDIVPISLRDDNRHLKQPIAYTVLAAAVAAFIKTEKGW